MSYFYNNTKETIQYSQEIIQISVRLSMIQSQLERMKLHEILNIAARIPIDRALHAVAKSVENEAAHMDSMGDALRVIANKYRQTEEKILGIKDSSSFGADFASKGTDKRNIFKKAWDWITNNEPDAYDTTTKEQEEAADAAMKRKLWEVLQDEKYSRENWDKASIEERKQILQDYMDEVIKIYGLQDVKSKINWDPDATYTSGSITWGYYIHDYHRVTLNEQALTDSAGSWDSYELLETVGHELRHAYQYEAIDHPTDYMVTKETIDKWDRNFDNYISSDDDYEGYRAQAVEADARDFQVSRDDNYADTDNYDEDIHFQGNLL